MSGRSWRSTSLHAGQDPARQTVQVLPCLHQAQVVIRLDGEDVQHLVEHLPMLPGDAHARHEVRPFLQRTNYRRHLDGFRTRAEDGKNADAHRRHPRVSITIFSLRSEARKLAESTMIDQDHDDIGLAIASCSDAVSKPLTSDTFGSHTRTRPILPSRKPPRDVSAGDFAHIAHVRLERDAKACDHRLAELLRLAHHPIDHPIRLSIVDLTRRPRQLRRLRRTRHNEPWIHRDAVTADAGSGLKDVDPRMAVCQRNDVPNID